MKISGMYLVDLGKITTIDNALSLYINGVLIAKNNDCNNVPVEIIAETLSEALLMDLNKVVIKPEEMAEVISGERPSSEEDAKEGALEYNDFDVLFWLSQKYGIDE
tara:strand:- start:584 stop:901 length:318 start_codon:yes stop_codon:yes gene_type:complete